MAAVAAAGNILEPPNDGPGRKWFGEVMHFWSFNCLTGRAMSAVQGITEEDDDPCWRDEHVVLQKKPPEPLACAPVDEEVDPYADTRGDKVTADHFGICFGSHLKHSDYDRASSMFAWDTVAGWRLPLHCPRCASERGVAIPAPGTCPHEAA